MKRILSPQSLGSAFFHGFSLGLALVSPSASAEAAFKWWSTHASAQGALPSEGPAAARLNPAALADVHLASIAYGHYGSISGKEGHGFLQLASGTPWELLHLPVGLAAGFGYMARGGNAIDGSNSSYQESEYTPGFALRLPADPEARWHLAAGLNFGFGRYNAFNALRSTSLGVDGGALFSVRGSAGLFGLGFAYYNLSSPRMRLPDGNPDYKVPGGMEPSAAWTSPARLVRAQVALYIDEAWDESEGPAPEDRVGIGGWELEVKPLAWFALKGERTRLPGRSNLGLVFYLPPEWLRCDGRMEINLGHERFDPFGLPVPFLATLLGGHRRDEGLGWLLGMSIGVGI